MANTEPEELIHECLCGRREALLVRSLTLGSERTCSGCGRIWRVTKVVPMDAPLKDRDLMIEFCRFTRFPVWY